MTAPVIGLILLAGVFGFMAWATRRNDRMMRSTIRHYARHGMDVDAPLPLPVPALPRPVPAPLSELETRRPTRPPSLESDVAVPLAQAVATAVTVGICAALLSWALSWSWRVPVAAVGVTLLVSWLWRLGVVTGLLWAVETLMQRDVTGDGRIGQPHAPVLLNPSQARDDARHDAQEGASEGRRRDLLRFAHRCYTVGTSERAHGVSATGPDRERYLELRDAMFALGLAQWRSDGHPRAGWVLTLPEGEASQVIARHVL